MKKLRAAMKNIRNTTLLILLTFFLHSNLFSQSNVEGEWGNPITFGIVPVAVANLPDGRLLTWSSQFRNTFIESGDGSTYSQYFDYRLNNGLGGVDGTEFTMNTNHDMFCPGINNLPDGRLLSAGGTSSTKTSIFDPSTGYWSVASEMNIPRGYQGNVTMSDGNVFTVGGSWSEGASTNGGKDAELWSPTTGWITLPNIQGDQIYTNNDLATEEQLVYRADNHVWLWSAPDAPDKIFHVGPSEMMHWIDPFATDANGNLVGEMLDAGIRQDIGAGEVDAYSMKGNTVMYDTGKILKVGGAAQYGVDYTTTTLARSNSFEIDLNGVAYNQAPNVTFMGDMAYERIYHNSTVLPDGKVLVTGGSTVAALFSDTYAVFEAELFDPEAPTGSKWSTVGAMQEARTYHSVAILMPDARVFVGGGGLCDGSNPDCINHFNAEIYSPPYLFDINGDLATRPQITSFNSGNTVGPYGEIEVGYNTNLDISTDVNVTDFSLIRFSAATHATNNEQRRISLTGSGGVSHTLQIPDRNLLPPGYYMLFALDANGVPSIAETLKIGNALPLPSGTNPNIVLELNFDETSGTVVSDSSGNGNNGTIIQRDDTGNQVPATDHQFVTGLFGNAIEFDGKEFQSNSIIEMDNSASFQSLKDKVTISAWVWRDADAIVPEDNNKIANVAVFAHDYPKNFMGFHNSLYKWSFETTDGFVNVYSGHAPLAGWNHIAGVYNGETVKLYANGVQIGQGSMTGDLVSLDDGSDYSKMTVSGFYDDRVLPVETWGNESGITDEVDGKMDQLTVLNVALGAEEIANLFAEGLATGNADVPNCEGNYLTFEYKIGTGQWQTNTSNRIVANEGDEVFIRAKNYAGEYFITTHQYDGPTFSTVDDTDKLTAEGAYQIDTHVLQTIAPWNNADRGNGLIDSSNNGYFVLTTPEGCPTAIELEVLADCDPGDTEIFAEFQINGIWCDNPSSAFPCGAESITIDEGTRLTISATPNSGTNPEVYPLTIKLPNGVTTGDNYVIESVDIIDNSGVYTITSAQGCSKTLEVIVNEVDCQALGLETEYQINGSGPYINGASSVDVNEGDSIILSILPNGIPYSIVSTSVNGNSKVNGSTDLTLTNLSFDDAGTYTFTTASGCSVDLILNVNPTDCNSLGLQTEYRINNYGSYILGATQVAVDEGNSITLSVDPNGIQYSIVSTSTNGNSKPMDFNDLTLDNLTIDDAGTYTFETITGCTVDLELTINEIDCNDLGLQTQYEVNNSGSFVSGEAEVRIAEGDEILLSVLPDTYNGNALAFSIQGPNGNTKELNPADLIITDVQEADEGLYTMTTGSGCEVQLLVLVGANENPVAIATASPLTGDAPLEVQFDGSGSTDDGLIASYEWDFGDGNSSTEQNPTYTFSSDGNYTVTLTVTDSEGAENSTTIDITVNVANQPPTAVVSATPESGVVPLEVNFSSAGSTDDSAITGYSWDFDDGNTSTEENPIHTFTSTGVYTVTLTVTDIEGLEDTASIDITVNTDMPPTASISANPVLGTAPLLVNFDSSGSTDDVNIVSYSWDFGDGNSSSEENPSHTYTTSDTYTATLTVTDTAGQEDSETIDIVVESAINDAPIAVATATPLSGIVPLEVTFNSDGSTDDKAIVSYNWDFGDGNSSTLSNPTHTFTTIDTFTVTLTVFDEEGLQNTDSITIEVYTDNEAPIASASATPTSGSAPLEVSFSSAGSTDDNGIVSFEWDFDDGTTSSEENPTKTFNQIGSYTVTLTVTDAEGLQDTASIQIIVEAEENEAPNALANANPVTGTAPLLVNFNANGSSDDNGIVTYSWDFGDGNTSNDKNPVHTYTEIGNYTSTLTVTDEEGLQDSDTVDITVEAPENQAPVAQLTANPLSGTAPLEISFSSAGSTDDKEIVNFSWDFGNGDSSNEENPVYTFEQPGSFSVTLTVTDEEGLEDSATLIVVVSEDNETGSVEDYVQAAPNPASSFSDLNIVKPSGVIATKLGVYDNSGRLIYTFVPSDIFLNGRYRIPVSNLRNGLYYVKIDYNEGGSDTIRILVRI